jgi:hypothetical protein
MGTVLGLIVGAVFLGVAAHGALRNMRLRRAGGRAMAEVTDIREHTSTNTDGNGITTTSHTYNAVLQFTTGDGRAIVAEECNGSGSPHARRGQQVPVRYDSTNPQTVEIDTFGGRGNAQILVSAVVGVAVIVFVAIH